MHMKVFVANLPYHLRDSDIRQLFEVFGPVSSTKLVPGQYPGKNKGFGFLEMPDREKCLKAISALNGAKVGARTITVKADDHPTDARIHKRARIAVKV